MQASFINQKQSLEARRDELFHKIDNPPEDVKLVTAFFQSRESSEASTAATTTTVSLESLAAQGITAEALESYYRYGKFKYECGIYNEAEEMLGNYLSISHLQSSSVIGAKWGRLACRILGAKWDLASQDLASVKEAIDVRNVAPVDLLKQRAWLLHWALFVHINQRDGIDSLTDFFSEKVYLLTLENICPWLLRYYAAFVVLSQPNKRRILLKDVINEILLIKIDKQYNDPIISFLYLLYIEFDLNGALIKLKECQQIMKNDFFLQIYSDKFLNEGKILLCEIYYNINNKLDFKELSIQFDMSIDETERWVIESVANFSLNSGLNSSLNSASETKIDSGAKVAIIAPPTRSAYQTIIERTRDITTRCNILSEHLNTLLKEQGGFIRAKMASV